MTAVGKILVFFNLIFSLVVGAFVVVVYISQAHWAHDYDDLMAKYQVADASLKAYQDERKKDEDFSKEFNDRVVADADMLQMAGLAKEDDVPTKVKKIKDTLKSAKADVETLKANADDLRNQLVAAQKSLDANDAALTSARAEVDKRQAESKDARDRLTAEEKKNLDLVQQMGKEHDQMVAWKIRADSAELREKELEKENDRLARDNQKLIANGGNLLANKKEGPNPPLENIEGLVSEVDPSGLVRITIGSDAGLTNGNTLEVYRLNTAAPDQSRYLGRLKIIKVSNTEAVGEMMTKSPVPLQPGDTVSSHINGG